MECVDLCNAASVPTVTGCEAIWDQSNRGCYVHTKEVARGNGVDRHSCWVLSHTSREDFLPTLAGFCVTESGSDQNSGVIKLADGDYGPSEDKKMECVDLCNAASVPTVTGCEAIWDQSNRGCYVHTQEVARGNGVDRHSCWVLSSTPPNVPTMYPTHRAPSPYPTEVPPTPYPTGKKCASLFEPCKKHNDCCKEGCNKIKGFCRK